MLMGGDGVNYAVTAISGSRLTVSTKPSAGCLASGDEVMLINLKGTSADSGNAGNYEFLTVSSIDSVNNYINLSSAPAKTYGNPADQKIMVQRVPNYSSVTISSTGSLTANGWDGTKGGIIAFRASQTVNVQNNPTVGVDEISTSGLGFRGGTGATSTGNAGGGESYNGFGSVGGTVTSAGSSSGQGGGGGGISSPAGGTGSTGTGAGGGGANRQNSTNYGSCSTQCIAYNSQGQCIYSVSVCTYHHYYFYSGNGGGGGYGSPGSGGSGANGGQPGSGATGGNGSAGTYSSTRSSAHYTTVNSYYHMAGGGGGGGTDGNSDSSGLSGKALFGGGGGGGGGASDISIGGNRVFVAGGGGGNGSGGAGGGGGFVGLPAAPGDTFAAKGGSQTSGGGRSTCPNGNYSSYWGTNGSLGAGGNGGIYWGGGGGGGLYGGGGAQVGVAMEVEVVLQFHLSQKRIIRLTIKMVLVM